MQGVTAGAHPRRVAARPSAGPDGSNEMVDIKCPWCEAELLAAVDAQAEEQTCPECLTSWSYEERTDVALAA